ncbi:MAG TPA: aldehyde dehydrogenase [Syntrophomonadaceae bacterium]|nr:aldehyde dehydrogenase [Syntrophomonadaceae bacterium]
MADAGDLLRQQRAFFNSGASRDLSFRLEQLKLLKKVVQAYEDKIVEALYKDMRKAPFESYETEIGMVYEEINYALKRLKKWVRPEKVKTPITNFLSRSYIYHEPYGQVLIIAPWNYPFQLSMLPLLGSMAAGNCTVLKPSEFSPHTSAVIRDMISENFDRSYIAVMEGGIATSQELLAQKFDYIFFTGNPRVGRIVMQAAAKNLIPVTLELGGKSPCIVDDKVNLDLAARRIVWGKYLNAGQTCVAPDYLLVHYAVKDKLLSRMKEYLQQFYGQDPLQNEDYTAIINQRHFKRLIALLNEGEIIVGGDYSLDTLHIAPTIIDQVDWDMPIMQEEIFGPLLPVMAFDDLKQLPSLLNSRPKPLALYFFSTHREHQKIMLENTSFGGGCINDTIMHLATPYLPFGGVGESGMGSYHGSWSFDTFSHRKSVLKKSNLIDIKLRYPPYTGKLSLLKKIMR